MQKRTNIKLFSLLGIGAMMLWTIPLGVSISTENLILGHRNALLTDSIEKLSEPPKPASSSIEVEWECPTGGGMGQTAFADLDGDGILEVVASSDGKLYAINGEDGAIKWIFETNFTRTRSTPVIGDIDGDKITDIIFHAINESVGKLFAVDGESGKLKWNIEYEAYGAANPSLADIDADGTIEIVIVSHSQNVVAINGENGTIQWQYGTGDWIGAPPAVGDVDGDGTVEIVVGSENKHIYAINGKDGSKQWSFETEWWSPSGLALGDINENDALEIVFGSMEKKVYALDGRSGKEKWIYETQFSTPTIAGMSSPSLGDVDGDEQLEILIECVSEIRTVFLLNRDGSLQWKKEGLRSVFNTLADIDGDGKIDIMALNENRDLCLLNGFDGSTKIIYDAENEMEYGDTAGDIDGDGKIEMLATQGNNTILIEFPKSGNIPQRIEWQGRSGDNGFMGCRNVAWIDPDGDFLSNYSESLFGTDPTLNDTDGDGVLDGTEIHYGANPLKSDTDGDGLSDYDEIYIYKTDPSQVDTDGDGIIDGKDIAPANGFIPINLSITLLVPFLTILGAVMYWKKKKVKKKPELEQMLDSIVQRIENRDLEQALESLKKGEKSTNFYQLSDLHEKYASKLRDLKTNEIKHVVIDMGTKFSRLNLADIVEKCDFVGSKKKDKKLVKKTLEEMIENETIFAEYFANSSSVAFNQQANIEHVDDFMESLEAEFTDWEQKEKTKEGKKE